MGIVDLIGWLPILLIGGIILYAIKASASTKGSITNPLDAALQARNQEWIEFITLYDNIANTAAEKQLVRRMLFDIQAQGLGISALAAEYKPPKIVPTAVARPANVVAEAPVEIEEAATEVPSVPNVQLDNTSLLLYFGAFLFVASVGLFVTLGSASGGLRSLAVLMVMSVMYTGGIWIFKHQSKLQQAGVAFAGIGIVMAPLVGLAFYNYVFTQSHGPTVWLVTSLLSLGLYLHALFVLRKPLISYLLIFTFLSLFESGISITSAPVYYFGWGLAFVGIILQLAYRYKGYLPELRESSRQSSQILLPLAVLASVSLVQAQGSGQLGISLLLATAFYGMEALAAKAREQEAYAAAAQATAIAGVACLAYSLSHSLLTVISSILLVNLVQVSTMLMLKVRSQLWLNFGSVMLLAAIADILLAVTQPRSLLLATGGLATVSVLLWLRQRRADAYGIAALSVMALPYEYGQLVASPTLPASHQAALGLGLLAILLLAYLLQYKSARAVDYWYEYARTTYVLGAVSVAAAGVIGSPLLCLVISLSIAASMLLLAELEPKADWAEAAAIVMLLPMLRSWDNLPLLLASTLIGLALYIGLSLRYRREFFRWGSTILWLLLPVSLGRGLLGSSWQPAQYAWAYMAAMAGLILSRAIARGSLLFSSKIPLSTYTRSASYSYVAGYCTAALLALGISLASDQSRLHTSVILVVLMAVVIFVGIKIERRPDVVSLLPILAQALLLSIMRPQQQTNRLTMYLLSSTVLAIALYLGAELLKTDPKRQLVAKLLQAAVLITAFISPLAFLFVDGNALPMAGGLLVAGILLSHYLRDGKQVERELAGGLIAASLLWLLRISGVHEPQAYTHVVVVTFAIYTCWRNLRGEFVESINYLQATLITATVPLAIQALGSPAGGLYGWWLLLEQVIIMLLGMAIKSRLATLWGLYVAVGAVLLQLRNLGYVALTFLAVFLIGLAVYRLQRHDDTKK